MPKDALLAVLAAIDAANAAVPNSEPDGRPAALVYGERMSEELARRSPHASEHLQIAARGQHVERWKIARSDYPDGRAGYLQWRTDEARAHAERVTGLWRTPATPPRIETAWRGCCARRASSATPRRSCSRT